MVDRKWYERNKHIFPASRWEVYDPKVCLRSLGFAHLAPCVMMGRPGLAACSVSSGVCILPTQWKTQIQRQVERGGYTVHGQEVNAKPK